MNTIDKIAVKRPGEQVVFYSPTKDLQDCCREALADRAERCPVCDNVFAPINDVDDVLQEIIRKVTGNDHPKKPNADFLNTHSHAVFQSLMEMHEGDIRRVGSIITGALAYSLIYTKAPDDMVEELFGHVRATVTKMRADLAKTKTSRRRRR